MKPKAHCSHTEMVPVGELKEHPRNPNTHSAGQLELLSKIISEQGWRNPIVVSKRSGYIVAGHARLAAAKRLGMASVPVDVQPFKNEEAELAHLLADNRIAELAEMNNDTLRDVLLELDTGAVDMDLTGYDAAALEELMTQFHVEGDEVDAEPQIDRAKELADKWGTKDGQLWALGDHRLLCGDGAASDCAHKVIEAEGVDAVIADPPYGTGIDASAGLGNSATPMQMIGDGDNTLAKRLFDLWHPKAASHIWFGANYYASALPDSTCWAVWDKDHHGMTFADAELAWVGARAPVRVFRHAWSGNHRASEQSVERNHPTQKPVALYVWAINLWASDAVTIADPTHGSGTTLMACETLGRKCRAIEIDPGYVAVAIERWHEATGKEPKLIG